jgi:hypothetical protein
VWMLFRPRVHFPSCAIAPTRRLNRSVVALSNLLFPPHWQAFDISSSTTSVGMSGRSRGRLGRSACSLLPRRCLLSSVCVSFKALTSHHHAHRVRSNYLSTSVRLSSPRAHCPSILSALLEPCRRTLVAILGTCLGKEMRYSMPRWTIPSKLVKCMRLCMRLLEYSFLWSASQILLCLLEVVFR